MAIWINDKNLLNKHFTVSSFHFQWKHMEAEGETFGYAINGNIAYLINDLFVYAYDLESGKMLFVEIYHGKMTNPFWYEEGPDGWNHLKQVTDVEIMGAA